MSLKDNALNPEKQDGMRAGIWRPFAYPMFRLIWIALLISDAGVWFQDVGSGWLMTSLSVQPQVVSMLYVANILPMVLLSFPAGVLADLFGRRRILLGSQAFMAMLACVVALGIITHVIAPWSLILFTFLYWSAAAFQEPNLEALVPSLVPRNILPSAIGLVLVASNLGRVAGPLIAGLVIDKLGAASAYLFNAISFLGMVMALLFWKPEAKQVEEADKKLWHAFSTGLRYVRNNREIRLALICAALIGVVASAALALMPLHARVKLHAGSAGLGLLTGCVGAGSIVGAMLVAPGTRVLTTGSMLRWGIALIGVADLGMAYSSQLAPFALFTLLHGFSWTMAVTLVITAIQSTVDETLRARVLGVYVVAVGSGMTAGSLLWGGLAAHAELSTILACAGGTALGAAAVVRVRFHINLAQPEELHARAASATSESS